MSRHTFLAFSLTTLFPHLSPAQRSTISESTSASGKRMAHTPHPQPNYQYSQVGDSRFSRALNFLCWPSSTLNLPFVPADTATAAYHTSNMLSLHNLSLVGYQHIFCDYIDCRQSGPMTTHLPITITCMALYASPT